jgi:hypothetical protein
MDNPCDNFSENLAPYNKLVLATMEIKHLNDFSPQTVENIAKKWGISTPQVISHLKMMRYLK